MSDPLAIWKIPATKFDTPGLELDWTCVRWAADHGRSNSNWSYHNRPIGGM